MSAFKQTYRKDQKALLTLREESQEYKRVKYSLKLALRMINGSFSENFQVQQFNQSGINFENAHDKTTVECWLSADAELAEKITKQRGLIFSSDKPFKFTVGSIIN